MHVNSSDLTMNLDPAFAFNFVDPLNTTNTSEFSFLPFKDSTASNWDYPPPTSLAGMTPMMASHDTGYALENAKMNLSTSPEQETHHPDWLLWSRGNAHHTPPLVKHSMETLLRVMKTWPRMLAKGFQSPPFLHSTHVHPVSQLRPMANCAVIARLWSTSGDSIHVRQTIVQEMRMIFASYRTLDERTLLSALQALTLYIVMLMYPGYDQISVSLVDPAIFLCLQKVVAYIGKTGLMLTEERDNQRPSWESWIHVTAKRRAVFSLYLLHWSYSVYHGLESFACNQLGFMPAPAPKFLWQAESKEKWEVLYDRWLEQWDGSPYMMREFAAIQASTSLERRTEMWLEDADELGVLFFSIGTTVQPCVEWW